MSAYVREVARYLATFDFGRATVTTRHVGLLIAAHANPRTGEAWPGLALIAELAGVHYDTAYRAAARLRRAGAVRVTPRPGASSVYGFPLLAHLSTTPRADAGGTSSTTPRAGAGYPPRPRGGSPRAGAERKKDTEGDKKYAARGHFSPGSGWIAEG